MMSVAQDTIQARRLQLCMDCEPSLHVQIAVSTTKRLGELRWQVLESTREQREPQIDPFARDRADGRVQKQSLVVSAEPGYYLEDLPNGH